MNTKAQRLHARIVERTSILADLDATILRRIMAGRAIDADLVNTRQWALDKLRKAWRM